ncbi:hypothetical protein CkaCkLH20_07707 [Colletotrichum karsti]|uniref:DUF1772-domain-containing protein n=1 Tax=Colletotrichum karsti TaxID=1095194 RepID=A0A9P6I213_9PEZI|nr:uncharacterized protein CkaCkLH20_07707 [Colletotrichum karsti]KAF9875013.1 hypothetical protein CkaCkLH20_07707 [Colletotrichum karsti]
MPALDIALQATSISVSLVAAGGIATLTLFDVPILKAQPASRSLPSIRWLFSRGSHIFPAAAFVSGAGFGLLAFRSLPAVSRSALQLFKFTANNARANGYLGAGALSLSIALFTQVMIPNNFALIKKNEEKGGSRSVDSAKGLKKQGRFKPGQRSALDSVNGEGEVSQWTDLSGPQEQTPLPSTPEDDEMVREMLTTFGWQNMTRAVLMAAGGVVGIVTALA